MGNTCCTPYEETKEGREFNQYRDWHVNSDHAKLRAAFTNADGNLEWHYPVELHGGGYSQLKKWVTIAILKTLSDHDMNAVKRDLYFLYYTLDMITLKQKRQWLATKKINVAMKNNDQDQIFKLLDEIGGVTDDVHNKILARYPTENHFPFMIRYYLYLIHRYDGTPDCGHFHLIAAIMLHRTHCVKEALLHCDEALKSRQHLDNKELGEVYELRSKLHAQLGHQKESDLDRAAYRVIYLLQPSEVEAEAKAKGNGAVAYQSRVPHRHAMVVAGASIAGASIVGANTVAGTNTTSTTGAVTGSAQKYRVEPVKSVKTVEQEA